MKLKRIQKIALGIGGVLALAIGSLITLAPHAFYASYGITLGQDPNLLSELRAPGAGLAVLGAIMLAGIVRAAMAPVSLTVALTVFLAFPAGRILGIIMDGMPSGSVVGALVLEVVVAFFLLLAFKPQRPGHSTGKGLINQPS